MKKPKSQNMTNLKTQALLGGLQCFSKPLFNMSLNKIKLIFSFIILLIFASDINAQNAANCDTLRGYKFGANMSDSFPFFPQSGSPFNINYVNYTMMYSDLTRTGDDYYISSTSRFNDMTIPALPPNLTHILNYPKLHINDNAAKTYRDVKYHPMHRDRIFSNTPIGSGEFYLSGSTNDISTLNPTTNVCAMPCTIEGTITHSNINGSQNNVILTRSGEYPVNDGDVILKTVEAGGYIYAVGYKIVNQNTAIGTLLRRGILYVIDKSVLNSTSHDKFNCTNPSNTTVRQFRIQSCVTDIMVEPNGTIIVSGTMDRINGTLGFIGSMDINTNTARFNYFSAHQFLPAPINNNAVIMTSMIRGQNTGEYYALYNIKGGNIPGGALGFPGGMYASMGFVKFNSNLTVLNTREFTINLGPGAAGPLTSAWANISPSSIDYDNQGRLYLSAYVGDVGCIIGAGGPCFFRHITFRYDPSAPSINSIGTQAVNGVVDFGFTQLDPDPFARLGGPVNSVSTLNKVPRTLVMNDARDTVHIAYLVREPNNINKSVSYHYKRDINTYNAGVIDDCSGIMCFREPFNTTADTPHIRLWGVFNYPNLSNNLSANMAIETNVYEVHDCQIEFKTIEAKWLEEYPSVCRELANDGLTNCDFWLGIGISSGRDTLCINTQDTLSVIYRSPFGLNTFEWVKMSNPNTILSTERILPIVDSGTYRVICTRNLSDGTICSDTFSQIIYPAEQATIIADPNGICQGLTNILSISNPAPDSFLWTRSIPFMTIDSTDDTLYTNIPDSYHCRVVYPNGCIENMDYDLAPMDLEISQDITETASAFEDLRIFITNHNSTDADNVTISTGLVPDDIRLNDPTGLSGWTLSGGVYEYIIPTIPANTTSTIIMPVRVNKCKSTNLITATFPAMTCPSMISTRTYWDSLDFVAKITDSLPISCYNIPMTLHGTPTGSSYTYQWLHNAATVSTTPNCIAITTGGYDLRVSRYQCTRSVAVNLISYPEIIITNTIVPAICTTKGEIKITATSGTPPYQYAIDNGAYTINNVFSNLSGGSYTIKVRDTNGCIKTKLVVVAQISDTIQYTDTIVHYTCNSMGSIGISTPTTTGSCPADSYTYLWSTGQTTQSISNLIGGTYTLTVTNCHGCTLVKSFKIIDSNNILTAQIVPQLMDCSQVPHSYQFTVFPSGGIAPYTILWYRNNIQIGTGSTLLTTDTSMLYVKISTSSHCLLKKVITPTTIIDLNTTILNYPATISNAIIKLPTNLQVTGALTLINCDVSFMAMGDRITIESPTLSDQAGIQLISSRVHTCGNYLARGIILTKTGDYIYPQNSKLEDMFAAIAIEPATPADAIGSFFMPMSNNTFKNNFIGIRINAPDADIVQKRIISATIPVSLPIVNFFSNNTFQGATLIKPYLSSFYPHILEQIFDLEKPFNSLNWGSYAGFVGNNKDFKFSEIPQVGGSPSPNSFSNLANGILTSSGLREISNCKFENINPATTISSGNSSYAVLGYGVYGLGTSLTTDKLIINGYGSYTADMTNVRTGVYARDMHLTINNMIMQNITERAIYLPRNIPAGIPTPGTFTIITNNKLSARVPIEMKTRIGDVIRIDNNNITDILPPTGGANTSGAMVDIAGSAVTLSNNPTLQGITNNTITQNYSRYGIRIVGTSGLANNVRYPITNNKIAILNSTNDYSYAGIYLQNTNNYNVTSNTIHLALGNATPTITGPLTATSGTTGHTAPIGIWTDTVTNLKLSCNNFYTQSGTFHNGSHTNFELITNNYVTKNYGELFKSFSGGSTIRGMSNKFYCGLPAANFMVKITNTTPGANNSNINASFGTGIGLPLPTPCFKPLPNCITSPASFPSYSYYPSTLNAGLGFNLTPAATADANCRLACNLPKFALSVPTSIEPDCILYPNPSSGTFTIALENIDNLSSVDVEILNIQGRRVFQTNKLTLKNNQTQVQTKLTAGNYFVRISHASGLLLIKKLTIE